MPSGALLPHMSARLRTQTIDALFVATGGFERAQAWIEKSDDNYGTFFKDIWARGAAKAVSAEIGVSEGVESLLERLDERERSERATIIEGEVIDHAPQKEYVEESV